MFLSKLASRSIIIPPTMKLSLKTLLVSFIFSLLSCQGKEEPVTREKLLSRGFTLMDQGKYDEAIEYFGELAAHDPHHHVKMAWASAYAGRAGIKLEQLYSFIVAKKVEPLEIALLGLPANKQTSELMLQLSHYINHWNRVPVVSTEKSKDIYSAVKVLDGVEHSGARLYSAALRVVLIKTSVTVGLDNWQVSAKKKICSEDMQAYFQWALNIIDELISLSADLQGAFPERQQEYEDISQRLIQIKKDAESIPWPRENLCL